MKVIEINKEYRGGSKKHNIILLDEPYLTNEDIEYIVVDWCNGDISGSNYGYTYDWNFIEDKEEINKVINNEIRLIELQIESKINRKNKLIEYIK